MKIALPGLKFEPINPAVEICFELEPGDSFEESFAAARRQAIKAWIKCALDDANATESRVHEGSFAKWIVEYSKARGVS